MSTTLEHYTAVLTKMTRASRTDSAAQLLGLQCLAPLFSDKNLESLEREKVTEVLETVSHLTKAVHRAVTSNMSNARVASLGLRICAHICGLEALQSTCEALIFKENIFDTAVEILRTHVNGNDVAVVRSSLCLLNTLLSRTSNSGIIKFQRIHQIGETLNNTIKQHIDDAPTVEWVLATSSYIGEQGGRGLPKSICMCMSTHPTDAGVVRSGLSACCSLARSSEMNRMVLLNSGCFSIVRSVLDLRPAHRDVVVSCSILICNLLRTTVGQQIFKTDSDDRLVRLLAGCLPHTSELDYSSSFTFTLRSVLTCLAMISLSSEPARHLLVDSCGVDSSIEKFLELKLPTVRLRFDIEFSLAAIRGELEKDAKDQLLKEMKEGSDGTKLFAGALSLKEQRGKVMKPTRDHNGVVGMKMGSA